MESRARTIGLALCMLVIAACNDGATTAAPTSETTIGLGHLTQGVVLLDGEPDPSAATVGILVTYGGCSGGTLPREVEDIHVTEDDTAVVIEALIRIPDSPFETTCPENPYLPEVVELESPLGGRSISFLSTSTDRPERIEPVELWPNPPAPPPGDIDTDGS